MENDNNTNEKGNAGWLVLGLFFPLIGLILWLVWKDDKPADSKQAGKGALIGVIVGAVLGVVVGILYGSLLGSLLATAAVCL